MEQRKIIRAFLASPGDLQGERLAIKDVVDEVNELIANPTGYHIELVGWEYTVSQPGRAQAVINRELERCELFIGMIWKRWGTPPSDSGPYSSGFEEEFELSAARMKETGFPRMSLYFKDVPPAVLEDPGPELKKVLAFKKRIIASRTLYFEEFQDEQRIEKKIRKLLARYIQEKSSLDNTLDGEQSQISTAWRTLAAADSDDNNSNTSSDKAITFLKKVASSAGTDSGLSDLDSLSVARLRLVGQSSGTHGNDTSEFGVHDANLIFGASGSRQDLSYKEVYTLYESGLGYFPTANVPLWYWARSVSGSVEQQLTLSSAFGLTSAHKEGALGAMFAAGVHVTTEEGFSRKDVIAEWFRDKSTGVRTAALRYLALFGVEEDIESVERELSGSDFATKRPAIIALVRLLLRYTPERATQIVLDNGSENLPGKLANDVLPHFAQLSDEQLLKGLRHRNGSIRLRAAELLLERGTVSEEALTQLREDPSGRVRAELARFLLRRGDDISLDQLRKLVVGPRPSPRGIGALWLGEDTSGESEFEQLRVEVLCRLPDTELDLLISLPSVDSEHAYFAKCRKRYAELGSVLRRHIKDGFREFFTDTLEHMRTTWGVTAEPLIVRTKELESVYRNEYLKEAVKVVTDCGAEGDLQVVREIADAREVFFPLELARFLGRYGDVGDGRRVAMLATSNSNSSQVDYRISADDIREIASCILRLHRGVLADALAVQMHPSVKSQVIEISKASQFHALPPDRARALLFDPDSGVRRSAVLKLLTVGSKAEIRETLQAYLRSSQAQYYNVIHWLDFGASLSLSAVRKGALRMMEQPTA